MTSEATESEVKLDLSDLDKWVGKEVVFAELWDPGEGA